MATLSISNEDIENHIKQSLINAGIGEAIKKSIADMLNERYNNPFEKSLRIYLENVVMELVKTKFSSDINSLLEGAIRDFIEKKGFESIFKSLRDKLERLDDGY